MPPTKKPPGKKFSELYFYDNQPHDHYQEWYKTGEKQTDIIMLTHQTQEKNVESAIARIEALPTVVGQLTKIRLEALS